VTANSNFIRFKVGDHVYARRTRGASAASSGLAASISPGRKPGWRSVDVPAHTLRRAAPICMWRAIEPKED
jgi:hypothetical protein